MHPFATSGGLAEVRRRAASGAGAARPPRHGDHAPVSPRRDRARTSRIDNPTPHRAEPAADASATIDMGERAADRSASTGAQLASASDRGVRRRAGALRSRRPLRRRRRRLSGQRVSGSRCSAAPRSNTCACAAGGHRSSTPTTGRRGWCPAYQKMLFSPDPVVGGVPVVFTIHNLAFQGIFPAETLDRDRAAAGTCCTSRRWSSTAASATSRPASTSASGSRPSARPTRGRSSRRRWASASRACSRGGRDDLRRHPQRHRHRAAGIRPTDPFVPARYSADDLAGKAEAKRLLLADLRPRRVRARRCERPLIGLVSRLTDQKGFDLIAAAADELMALDAAWVMLGSGERRYEELWTDAGGAVSRTGSARTIGYDERLEHLIEAGADAFLMPSRFEPCGLNQMNSLRYGTLPIVRATGGLERHRARTPTAAGRHRLQVRRTTRPTRWWRRSAGRSRLTETPERWKRMQRDGDGGRITPGTSRPGSMSKCTERIPEDYQLWLLKRSRP